MKRARLCLAFLSLVVLVAGGCGYFSPLISAQTATPLPTPLPTETSVPVAIPPPLSVLTLPSISAVAEKVKPAVASVLVESVALDFFLQPIPQRGAGSGVIFDTQGYILTNDHVVAGARQISVVLPDGRTFEAILKGRDPLTDLAVLKIEGDRLPTARLGNSTQLKVGDWVVAIGNALGLEGGPTVTVGVVSALGRSIEEPTGVTLHDLIQTDAAINPGNSGGPLVNLAGEVVGINTAIAGEAQGIGFAISSTTARPIMEDLVTRGRVVRPQLGIIGTTVTPAVARRFNLSEKSGVLLTEVSGPAARAGLRRGDIVVAFAGEKVSTLPQLQYQIWKRKAGDTVEVTFVRDSNRQTVTATLAERPPEG